MSAPLYGLPPMGLGTGLAVALLLGVVFGVFLEQAGLGNARKLCGQFYLTDLTVFKVMFAAIITASLGVFWMSRIGVLDVDAIYVPDTFLAPHLVGGAIFGVGMVLAGLCPGTSCVAASSGRQDGMAVAVGMCCGILAFNEFFPFLADFYRSTPMGPVTLPRLLHVPQGWVVLGLVGVGLFGFAAAEALERRASRAS